MRIVKNVSQKVSIIYTFPHAGNKAKITTPLVRNRNESHLQQSTRFSASFHVCVCDSSSIQSNPIDPKGARVAPKRERMPDTG
jgi:hypothetical protein